MAGWLVTQGDRQFSAQDLGEIVKLATSGEIGPGDLLQPPGASDWLYALELPELQDVFPDDSYNVDVDWKPPRRSKVPLILILSLVAGLGGYGMWYYGSRIPTQEDLELLGPNGLQLTEMLVTVNAEIHAKPNKQGTVVASVAKNEKVQLLAKRNDWYTVKTMDGKQGYVPVNHVVPAYFFADAETRASYDPVYNPDQYVEVENAAWMQQPHQRELNTTRLSVSLRNESKFEMKGIKLVATIKDKNDRVLERKEISLEGSIAAKDSSTVGTLIPPEDTEGPIRQMTTHSYDALYATDNSLMTRWSDGVEVPMSSDGFVEADVRLLEVRAIPIKR